MKLYCGIIVKLKSLSVLKSLFTRQVFADGEPNNGETPPHGAEKNEGAQMINYEELIARARKEEKDKLYSKIKSLEDKVASQTNTINSHLLTIGTKDTEIADLKLKLQAVNSDDSETVKNLKLTIASLQTELAGLKENQPITADEEALRITIRNEVESEFNVKLYRLEKLKEVGEEILTPELVTGLTNEEIDMSIDEQKVKTLEIKRKLGIVDDEGNLISTTPKKPKATPNNPPKDKGQKKVDFDYLAELDPASTEYAEARKKLGLR